MAARDPDLIALSGRRRLLNFNGSTVDAIIVSLASELGLVGWTTIASGTLTGHPFYDMLSQQSRWWDPDVPPPGIYKGQVRVLIHSDNANTVKLKPSNWDGSLTLAGGDPEIQLAKDAASRRIISCPFQFETYVPTVLTSGVGNLAAIVSAPHTPRFVQENLALEECIVAFAADNFRRHLTQSGTNQQFFCVKNSLGTFKWSGGSNAEGNLRFLAPVGGRSLVNFNVTSGYFAYNVNDDPLMTDVRLWYGFLVPPTMMWGRSSGTAGPVFDFAWLWDCLLNSQAYSGDVAFPLANGLVLRNFQDGNVGDNDGATLQAPGTLMFASAPGTDP